MHGIRRITSQTKDGVAATILREQAKNSFKVYVFTHHCFAVMYLYLLFISLVMKALRHHISVIRDRVIVIVAISASSFALHQLFSHKSISTHPRGLFSTSCFSLSPPPLKKKPRAHTHTPTQCEDRTMSLSRNTSH